VRGEAAATLGGLNEATPRALTAALDDAAWQVLVRAARPLGRLQSRKSRSAGFSRMRSERPQGVGARTQRDRRPRLRAVVRLALDDPDADARKSPRWRYLKSRRRSEREWERSSP
jgi:hypothetical protein